MRRIISFAILSKVKHPFSTTYLYLKCVIGYLKDFSATFNEQQRIKKCINRKYMVRPTEIVIINTT